MSRILIAALLGYFVVFSAVAADVPQDEIVYRASLGRADDIKMLLKQGATPDGKNDKGVPLLALAAARKDDQGIPVIKVLLDAGAPIDEKDSDGQTPLFYAVKSSNMKMVKYLLSHGADFYATDNSGNTARNIAYTTNHKDIGVAIDDFIKTQAAERTKQYEEYNQTVAERLKPQQPPSVPETVSDSASTPSSPEDLASAETAQKKRQEDIKRLASDLAFDNCAFQYWSYLSDVGQSSELSADARDEAIESYKDNIVALEDQLSKDYKTPPAFIIKISNSAKQRIFNELNVMPSKSYRHEEGVGKDADMQSRCKAIARRWDAEPPPLASPQSSSSQPQQQQKNNVGGNSNLMPYNSGPKNMMPAPR